MKSRNSEQFEKISELMNLDKFDKGVQLYVREVFEVEGNLTDRALLIAEKLGINNSIISEADQLNAADNIQVMLELFDNDKPVDMFSVDAFKWNAISESVKKPDKINMSEFKWTDSAGAERVLNEGSGTSYINQSFWNDAHKRIYLTPDNIVEYSNYHGVSKGDKLEISDVQRLKTKGHQIVYTK